MLLRNLPDIVWKNYSSLADESGFRGRRAWVFVVATFVVLPIAAGTVAGRYSPIWSDLIRTLITATGVLTGFSINALVLLTSHTAEKTYEQKTTIVEQTQDFTLYSVLVGVSLLLSLVGGYILTEASVVNGMAIPFPVSISASQLLSFVVYSLLAHYFLILLVIVHRLYTLVDTNALNNG
ncbi:hypothetical protein [Salinirubrum litoreum]|uniref:Uncharacterized protein n=1 Tax=Salinirubrum litoreum TaxID=1126234 RepID=A0ABD5RB63_9EURY|nr:hypothetical protein [Salinirubrum litoreum]